jgi:hypothetical protein
MPQLLLSSSTTSQALRLQLWSSDKLRTILEDYTLRHLGVKIGISSWRHIAISISRRFLQGAFGDIGPTGALGDSGSDSDGEGGLDSPWDLQAGHSSHVAGMIYGREIQQGTTGVAAQQEHYRKVSTTWHRFFNFGSQDLVSGRRVTESLFTVARSTVREKRLQRLRQVDLQGRLQQLFHNPKADFRGNQKDALDAVIRGFSPVLQITRTGGGKSLTFLLPSYCSTDGTTIVIVPFVALQDDL